MSLGKTVQITEGKKLMARVEAYDVFNHRNFTVAGPLSVFSSLTGANAYNSTYVLPNNSNFLNAKQFSGGARNRPTRIQVHFLSGESCSR